jgi:hypothetical protein
MAFDVCVQNDRTGFTVAEIKYSQLRLFGRFRALVDGRTKMMIPNRKKLDKKDGSDAPLENQPLGWADEDREMEDRKPDLSEIEEDTSEL